MANDISHARQKFRKILLVLVGISTVFFVSMVTLRMNKSAHWYVVKNYTENIFTVDVWKHQMQSMFQDEEAQHSTAAALIQKGIFSKQYSDAGLIMVKGLADDGYAPSQTLYGDVLIRSKNEEDHIQAKYYYTMAASDDYEPAKQRLAFYK